MTLPSKRRKTSTKHKDETGHYLFNAINETQVQCMECDEVFKDDN